MSETNAVKLQSEKGRVSLLTEFAAGVADGNECRRQGGTPSTLRLVAINDDYSAGFRAGFFQRAFKPPADDDLNTR